MNHKDLVQATAKSLSLPVGPVEGVIGAYLQQIVEGLRKDRDVTLQGIGRMTVIRRHARSARNPRTGERIEVPERQSVKYTPAPAMRKFE
jgi:DNA-binding protein HU-beta